MVHWREKKRRIATENCYYHPDTKAVTSCASCNRPICSQDVREKTESTFDLLECCCTSLCGVTYWGSRKKRKYCFECYSGNSSSGKEISNQQGMTVQDR